MSAATNPEDLIVARLEGNDGVTAIAGAECIYPIAAPTDATRPFLIYTRDSMKPASMDLDNKQYDAQLTIESWADTYDTARALATAVRKALIGWKHTDDAFEINTVMLVSEDDDFEQPLPGQEMPLYGVNQQFDYSYEEV